MLELAFLIGAYCYSVFLLGILGLLYSQIVVLFAIAYFVFGVYYLLKVKGKQVNLNKFTNLSKILLAIIFIEAIVNLIGVLGPELSFDALWYHLALPKIFLENHKIFHIPGNILYYSDMPKSIEMIYVFALSVGNEITAKFIHFLFGIGSLIALHKLSKRFFNQDLALLSVVVFYSSLVVGWQSITAYIDLGTTFFSILAVSEFLNWVDKKDKKHLLFLAILTGLSVSTKITSVFILPVFILLIFIVSRNRIKDIAWFTFLSVLISFPWFLFSYLNTGNPFFPIFSQTFSVAYDLNPVNLLRQIIFPSDPINPIYIISIPLLVIVYKRLSQNLKYLFIYAVLTFILWIFIVPVGGSRLILPYLPVFSILVVSCAYYLKSIQIKNYFIFLILLIAVSSISYRLIANSKYISVILGEESKDSFLTKHLNFSYGDFYDTDNYFKTQVKSSDKVLTFGFHNFYYIDFPFIDSSWVKKGDRFNYIATQNSTLPDRFSNFKQIHYNEKTGVKVYSIGGKMWEY